MANELVNPFQQFRDDGGRALASGLLEVFENGQTVVQKDIFSDSDLTVAQSNPYTLDDFGRVRGDVHYSGLATITLKNATGLFIRELDDVVTTTDGASTFATNLESVAAMVAELALGVGDVVQTRGYYAGTNYGGARYLVVAGGTGTFDGFHFHNLGNGLQAELLDRESQNRFLVAGARGDGGTDDTTAMQAVIDKGGDIIVESGFVFAGTSLSIGRNCRFIGGGTLLQLGSSAENFISITDRNVTEVKFRGITIDGNQQNGNSGNQSVSWEITS